MIEYIIIGLGVVGALFFGLRKFKPNPEKENLILKQEENKLLDEIKNIDNQINTLKVEELNDNDVVDYWENND